MESAAREVASKVQETKHWVGDKVDEAADAWVQEITPQNEEEAMLEQGLIPSNTADVLAGKNIA